MIRILAAAAALMGGFFMPAQAQQSLCVPDIAAMEEFVTNAKEKLIFSGTSSGGVQFWFFANASTYSVFFRHPTTAQICTGLHYTGRVNPDRA